jgi:uncharacterized tellurite resistance protein B-like protein
LLGRLVDFLKGVPSREGDEASHEDDPRIAVAALMFHVIDADGVRDEAERDHLRRAISQAYGLTGRELQKVVNAGEEAEREAVDLYAFTSIVNRHLDAEERIRLIELLWEIVFVDGERHELEDNVVWRIAELIGVSTQDRVAMRRRVSGRMDGESSN